MQMAEMRGDTATLERLRNIPAPKSLKDAKGQVKFMADQMTKMRNQPSKEDSSIRKQSTAATSPKTVMQTADFSKVKEQMLKLVDQYRGTDSKFEDTDFEPCLDLIFNQKDNVQPRDTVQIEMLKWLRPSQISIKSQIVGFYEINSEKGTKNELDSLVGNELADGHRICYG